MIRIPLLAAVMMSVSTQAWAYCSEPSVRLSAPDGPGSYARPSVPYCLSTYKFSGEHTCDQWEIDAYKRAVDEYVDQLQEYLNEAVEVAKKAQRYAEEVEAYARCEVDEVLSQHK